MSSNTGSSVPRAGNASSGRGSRRWRGGRRVGRGGAGPDPLSPRTITVGAATVLSSPTIVPGMSRDFITVSTPSAVLEDQRLASSPPNLGTIGRHFSDTRFADAPISIASKAGLKHEFLSDVQAATLDAALSGKDLLVQAKTGTGKTLAFLLPAVERLLKSGHQTKGASILVLSPTRELALQIEKEAESLLAHHPFKVQHAIGGTNANTEISRLLNSRCDILIATPGRLLDHLSSSGGALASKFSGLKTIVYDEADRLLDQGFKPALDAILRFLPPKTTRQSLLFSATVSKEIQAVVHNALRPGYEFISTLTDEEQNTHQHVDQTTIITEQHNFLQTTLELLQADLFENLASSSSPVSMSTSKCVVFFPTARQVGFAAEAFEQLKARLTSDQINNPPIRMHSDIYEIHSRKSQPQRMKAAEAFKVAKNAVLLSSDVAARGMDFPGVTLVIQVGLPESSDQYIHRLGRTGRAGKPGRGALILSKEEDFFLQNKEVKTFGITSVPGPNIGSNLTLTSFLEIALGRISPASKTQAYRAFLGYYNQHTGRMKMSKPQLVQYASDYAFKALRWTGPSHTDDRASTSVSGLTLSPTVDKRAVGKMGLKGVRGLVIVSEERPARGAHGNPVKARRAV